MVSAVRLVPGASPGGVPVTPEERGALHSEAIELDRITGVTDDTCHGRCADLRAWFAHETRGLLHEEEAHEVLDMLLNRLAADAAAVSQ